MEYLDIYDEEGNYLGKEDRNIVHRDALWHKTVHCWLFDKEGNVFFQIRKDEPKLYTTASGHVKAGETIKEAFGREVKEETGADIKYNDAILVGVFKWIFDNTQKDGSVFRDRAFSNVYVCEFDGSLEEFDYDEKENAGLVKINAKEALELLSNEKGSIKGVKIIKEDGIIKIIYSDIYFEDFLINNGETGVQKYGHILNKVIDLTANN